MRAPASVVFARLAGKARVRHLQLLVAIGNLGNLQKAAGAVGMSQPAATHALAELEGLVGSPLFERHSKGMRPTPLGAAVLPLLRNAIRALQQCSEVVAATSAGATRSLRIGAIGAAISGPLASALPAFSERHPDVMVDVLQLDPDDLMTALAQRTLDMAVCREPSLLPDGFDFVSVLDDRYAVVTSPDHPLAGRKVKAFSALAEHAWLMPPQGAIAGSDFARLCQAAEMSPAICWVTSRSPTLMWSMVVRRRLLSLVPMNSARPFLEAGILKEVTGPWHLELPPLGAVIRKIERQDASPAAALLAVLLQQ